MDKKVLVVDDNVDTVDLVKRVLQKEGYEVLTAFNGLDGYQRAQETQPDLILLDIMMPIMDGFTMNQHLKGNPKTENIPVIIISARSGMAPMFETENGPPIQGYMVKPVSSKVLLLKLEEVFKASQK
jgi:CheY-like chemotaxis protein